MLNALAPLPYAPWDRRPDESDTEYELFLAYLQLTGRRSCLRLALSLSAIASPYMASVATLRKLARRCEWSARTVAWDKAHPLPSLVTAEQFAAWDTGATPHFWDQQPGEPDAAYPVFIRYLAAEGRRSCVRALEAERAAQPSMAAALTADAIRDISAAWLWHERAIAWDYAHPAEASRRHAWMAEQRREREAAALIVKPRWSAATLAPDRSPWEQQPRESAKWYARFCRYLALGPTRAVYHSAQVDARVDPFAPSIESYNQMARRWHWRARAVAWDEHTPVPDEPAPGAGSSMALPLPSPTALTPWERQPGEPPRAFGVFLHFLELGPGRAIRRAVLGVPNRQGYRRQNMSSVWYTTADRWQWYERAAAWDAHQHSLLANLTLDHEVAAAEHRLAVAEILMDQALYALEIANLPGLTQEQARRMIGTIWRICKESCALQRAEFDYLDQIELRRGLSPGG